MSNTTFAKAIEVITYLQEQAIHNTVDGPIYIPKEYIATLEDLLISHHRQAILIKTVKEYSEKLKEQIIEQLEKEPEDIDLYTLGKTIIDFDFYLLDEELKDMKR
jgi:oligoribonuclease (3'-5' exoribonuclease)